MIRKSFVHSVAICISLLSAGCKIDLEQLFGNIGCDDRVDSGGDSAGGDESDDRVCIAEFDPACGIDGNTYFNACIAENEGVEIAYAGECEVTTATPCTSNSDCDSGQICTVHLPPCGDDDICPAVVGICISPDAPVAPGSPDAPSEPDAGVPGI